MKLLLVGLLRLVCLLMMVSTYSPWSVIIDQQNVCIHFLMKYLLQEQFLYCFTWSSNQFLILNSFSFLFLQTFLLINSISLCFNPWIFCHLLVVCITCFRVLWRSVLAVSCAFWMLWILVTVHKPCHVLHASRITTPGTIFTKICFGVSNKLVRSWSHVFLIT